MKEVGKRQIDPEVHQEEGSYQRGGKRQARERVLFIGTQFSILYTFVYSPA